MDTDAISVYPTVFDLAPLASRTVRFASKSREPRPEVDQAFVIRIQSLPPVDSSEEADDFNVLLLVVGTAKQSRRATAAQGLGVSTDGGQVTLTNQTPYVVVLDSLSVGGLSIDISGADVVPAQDSMSYPLPQGASSDEVNWTVTDRSGIARSYTQTPM